MSTRARTPPSGLGTAFVELAPTKGARLLQPHYRAGNFENPYRRRRQLSPLAAALRNNETLINPDGQFPLTREDTKREREREKNQCPRSLCKTRPTAIGDYCGTKKGVRSVLCLFATQECCVSLESARIDFLQKSGEEVKQLR